MASGSEPVKNIVLVGRAGNGKSATGNSIIRRTIFTSGSQATGVTMTCQTFRTVAPGGSIINVIDTPGLFDLITKPDVISKEIVRCLALAEEGLHAVVLVLSVRTRITREEEDSLCMLQILFGAKILDYLIVVFTGGDELDSANQTLESYMSDCPEFLQNIFTLCGHRKVLFYNRTRDEDQKNRQIQQLLDHVAAIGRRNSGIPFTEKMHRQIKEENMRLRKEEKEAEARCRATEIEQVKMRLMEEHERKMNEMATMMEDVIRDSWEDHQRMLRVTENMGARKMCNIM
uniref:Protein AIG1 n=1 Tax=Noccaea caerulescens TaxID=107243 RepID=A0A1J3DKZ5_NOCCA